MKYLNYDSLFPQNYKPIKRYFFCLSYWSSVTCSRTRQQAACWTYRFDFRSSRLQNFFKLTLFLAKVRHVSPPGSNIGSTHCVATGVRTGCGLWPWCCSSSGGCGTGAGTLRSSPSSRPRWPASLWGAGGTAGAVCSPDQGCCRTSPGSPGSPCTCRVEEQKAQRLWTSRKTF